MRVASVSQVGADSVMHLNRVVRPSTCGAGGWHYLFKPEQEGYWGDRFWGRPDGSYCFVSQGGDTIVFHTAMGVGSSWMFLSGSGLTATVVSRDTRTLFGGLDSVVTIGVSDGQQFVFSQAHGMVSGPGLSSYFWGDAARPSLLAEAQVEVDFKDYFEWQVGDVFTHREGNLVGWDEYYRYEVLGRSVSASGDTLVLSTQFRYAEIYPAGTGTNYFAAPVTKDLFYHRKDWGYLELATGELGDTLDGYSIQTGWGEDVDFPGRRMIQLMHYPWTHAVTTDSCGWYYELGPPCVEPYLGRVVEGLGLVWQMYPVGATMTNCLTDLFRLTCYTTVDDSVACSYWVNVLGVESETEIGAMRVLYQGRDGAPSLAWEGIAAGDYSLSLVDLSGKNIWKDSKRLGASGQITLPFKGVQGLYLLKVKHNSSGRAYVMKVVHDRTAD